MTILTSTGPLTPEQIEMLIKSFKATFNLAEQWDGITEDFIGTNEATVNVAINQLMEENDFKLARTLNMVPEEWIAELRQHLIESCQHRDIPIGTPQATDPELDKVEVTISERPQTVSVTYRGKTHKGKWKNDESIIHGPDSNGQLLKAAMNMWEGPNHFTTNIWELANRSGGWMGSDTITELNQGK